MNLGWHGRSCIDMKDQRRIINIKLEACSTSTDASATQAPANLSDENDTLAVAWRILAKSPVHIERDRVRSLGISVKNTECLRTHNSDGGGACGIDACALSIGCSHISSNDRHRSRNPLLVFVIMSPSSKCCPDCALRDGDSLVHEKRS